MFKLYILKSLKKNRHYIGITKDVDKRLKKHNAGSVKSTKPYRPWKLGLIERYNTKKEARKRELFLKKTAKARIELFSKIK